jgi:hypothetical protein
MEELLGQGCWREWRVRWHRGVEVFTALSARDFGGESEV